MWRPRRHAGFHIRSLFRATRRFGVTPPAFEFRRRHDSPRRTRAGCASTPGSKARASPCPASFPSRHARGRQNPEWLMVPRRWRRVIGYRLHSPTIAGGSHAGRAPHRPHRRPLISRRQRAVHGPSREVVRRLRPPLRHRGLPRSRAVPHRRLQYQRAAIAASATSCGNSCPWRNGSASTTRGHRPIRLSQECTEQCGSSVSRSYTR